MSKVKTVTELAEIINSQLPSFHPKAWEKNGKQRIYLSGVGYNTKKVRTTAYISLESGKAVAHCYIECASQSAAWIENEQDSCIDAMQPVIDACNEFFEFNFVGEDVEVVMNNSLLAAQPVQGYYTEWRSSRVPINRFGKLATRNRQYAIPYQGTKNDAPSTFVALTDLGYAYLKNRGEVMVEPYCAVPDFDQLAELHERARTQN